MTQAKAAIRQLPAWLGFQEVFPGLEARSFECPRIVARRMARAIDDVERRSSIAFDADGCRVDERELAGVVPASAVMVVLYPFRPSAPSCEALVLEFRATGQRVVYDQARWDADPVVDMQARLGEVPK